MQFFSGFLLSAGALALAMGCVSTPQAETTSTSGKANSVEVFVFKNLQPVGRAYFPKEFNYNEGGFSGASRVQNAKGVFTANEFWTVNDRGLNLYLEEKDSTPEARFKDGDRYFPVPRHQQTLFKIKLNANGQAVIVERLGLRENGLPTNGLPSALNNLATGERGWELKSPTGPFAPLPPSLQGYDFEGVAQTFDATGQREFWLVEEYGPSLFRTGTSGNILRRWSPARDFKPQSNSLPWALRHRADNRGFEGLTVSGDFVFAAMQSPLSPTGGASGDAGHGNPNTPLHRIIRLNKKTGLVEQFAYDHTPESVARGGTHQDVKIGDLAALDEKGERFLVLEHSNKRKHIVLVEASVTPDTTRLDDDVGYEAGKKSYKSLKTKVIADLAPALKNLELPEKAEGVSVIDEKTVLVVFDNDHCIEPLLAQKNAPKECENLVVRLSFAEPLFERK